MKQSSADVVGVAGPVSEQLPIGAEIVPGGVRFRVWAPRKSRVEVVLHAEHARGRSVELRPDGDGYFAAVAEAGPGTLYGYRLDGGANLLADPASRFQPRGVHGPSQVIDGRSFAWTDHDWRGLEPRAQIYYELHVGSFTPEGTWASARRELPALADLGVTAIEIMPVAEFPGRFGWGYDGVFFFAPSHLYGGPDDFRRFVDRAHELGVGVILDLVCNHVGPEGSVLQLFADEYFSKRYSTEWGPAFNFDEHGCAAVREFFTANAAYWVREFHLDGFRFDATQNVQDSSQPHIIAELTEAARQAAAGRRIVVVAENEPQDARILRPPNEGGWGIDAVWNDDFHHSAVVALTGKTEGYYANHRGAAQEFVSAAKYGFLYQGQWYAWQKQCRGTPATGLPHHAFVNYLENHDQVANSAWGLRLHSLAAPGRYRALTAVLLLTPGSPLLLQGQEFAASTPFLYFSDVSADLAGSVRRGRKQFLAQFRSVAAKETQRRLPDPLAAATFEATKLDHAERSTHARAYRLHRDLIALRRRDAVFSGEERSWIDGAVLSEEAFLLRFFADPAADRLLLVNLGSDLHRQAIAEPLLAPPLDCVWQVLWSSEHPDYGGSGTPPLQERDELWLPAGCAIVLAAVPLHEGRERAMFVKGGDTESG